MIDHMGVSVRDYPASKAFYTEVLASLALELIMEVTLDENATGWACGFGTAHNPFFWIGEGVAVDEGFHLAFAAKSRAQVGAFHAAALKAGATDTGRPGPSPALSSELLRRLRPRPERLQPRGRLPRAGVGPRPTPARPST